MAVVITISPDAPSRFPFEEKTARHKLGLTEDEMRALRKTRLTGSIHFVKHKKRLFLSAEGVDILFAAAGQPAPQKVTTGQEGINPGDQKAKKEPPSIVTLRVVRTDLANKHILLACPHDDDPDRPKRSVRVRVRSTANFTRRMEIPAFLVDGYEDLYDLARSAPRKKGKW